MDKEKQYWAMLKFIQSVATPNYVDKAIGVEWKKQAKELLKEIGGECEK